MKNIYLASINMVFTSFIPYRIDFWSFLCTFVSSNCCKREFHFIHIAMSNQGTFSQSDEYRREELIRVIEHSVERLTLPELEALYYDMTTKNYIND